MLVHPQFDPVAFHLGPLAVRWYGLMYLAGFVLFIVLGKLRARAACSPAGAPRDVDDMLFYGVFGVILGGRLGYVLFYKPLLLPRASARDLRGLARRHELPRRLPRRADRAVALRAPAPASVARRHRFRRAALPLGLGCRAARQLHQRRAGGAASPTFPGRWCSRRSTTCRGIRRSSTSSGSRACCCSSCCGSTRRATGRWARCRACS